MVIQLKGKDLLKMRKARGTSIRVLAGLIWVTEAERQLDSFLGAGSAYLIEGDGLVLVEHLVEGRLPDGAEISIVNADLNSSERPWVHRSRWARLTVSVLFQALKSIARKILLYVSIWRSLVRLRVEERGFNPGRDYPDARLRTRNHKETRPCDS